MIKRSAAAASGTEFVAPLSLISFTCARSYDLPLNFTVFSFTEFKRPENSLASRITILSASPGWAEVAQSANPMTRNTKSERMKVNSRMTTLLGCFRMEGIIAQVSGDGKRIGSRFVREADV